MDKRDDVDRVSPDDLDRVLDAALSRYAAIEPRSGLEERISANLSAERSRTMNHAWWKLGLAGVAAIVVVGIALAWRPAKRPSELARQPAISANPNAPIRLANRGGTSSAVVKKTGVRRPAPKPSRTDAVAAADPKLDQFPSPEPLTEEELALIRYVRQFPGEAATIARMQEDFEKEIQQQSKATRDGPSSDSEQQER